MDMPLPPLTLAKYLTFSADTFDTAFVANPLSREAGLKYR